MLTAAISLTPTDKLFVSINNNIYECNFNNRLINSSYVSSIRKVEHDQYLIKIIPATKAYYEEYLILINSSGILETAYMMEFESTLYVEGNQQQLAAMWTKH